MCALSFHDEWAQVESLKHALMLKEHELGLSSENIRTLETNVQQAADGLASERQHIHSLREDLAQRQRGAASRGMTVARSLLNAVSASAAAEEAPEVAALAARVQSDEALSEADAGTLRR